MVNAKINWIETHHGHLSFVLSKNMTHINKIIEILENK